VRDHVAEGEVLDDAGCRVRSADLVDPEGGAGEGRGELLLEAVLRVGDPVAGQLGCAAAGDAQRGQGQRAVVSGAAPGVGSGAGGATGPAGAGGSTRSPRRGGRSASWVARSRASRPSATARRACEVSRSMYASREAIAAVVSPTASWAR